MVTDKMVSNVKEKPLKYIILLNIHYFGRTKLCSIIFVVAIGGILHFNQLQGSKGQGFLNPINLSQCG
jgi:hypothetical protein